MKSGIVEFAMPTVSEAAISNLKSKVLQVEKRNPVEQASIQKIDAAIVAAMCTWRGLTIRQNLRALLKTPDGAAFNPAELDLAGWARTYAEQANLAFGTALERVFEYLKRFPKQLEYYTNSDANFAETASGSVSFVVPPGYSVDGSAMEVFRRARIYQAGHPGCDFVYAVQMSRSAAK